MFGDLLGGMIDVVNDVVNTAEEVVDGTLGIFLDAEDTATVKRLASTGADVYAIATMTGFGIDQIREVINDDVLS